MKKFILFAAIMLVLSGCATVFSGTKSKITIQDGQPAKASIYMNGAFVGETPITVTIPKKSFGKENLIEVRAEGYKPITITIEKKVQAGFLVLDVLTGLVWLVVDLADGGMYKPVQERIQYKLEKL